MPAYTPNDIWFFIYLQKKARYTDLHKIFVGKKKIANQTFINYLKELMNNKKIDKTLDEVSRTPIYFVPKNVEHEIKNLISNKEFDRIIDEMSEEELRETLKEIIHADV
jgi:hypothetical protein